MKRHTVPTLRSVLARRAEVLSLVFVGILLAIGVNLLSAGVAAVLPGWAVVAAGTAFIVGGLGYALRLMHRARRINVEVEAFVLFDPTQKTVISVDGYEFSEELARTLAGSGSLSCTGTRLMV